MISGWRKLMEEFLNILYTSFYYDLILCAYFESDLDSRDRWILLNTFSESEEEKRRYTVCQSSIVYVHTSVKGRNVLLGCHDP